MNSDTQSATTGRLTNEPSQPTATAVLDRLGVGVLLVDRSGNILRRHGLEFLHLPFQGGLDDAFAAVRFLQPFEGWGAELRRMVDQGRGLRVQCFVPAHGDDAPQLLTLRCTPWSIENGESAHRIVILVEPVSVPEGIEDRLEVSRRLTSLGKIAARVAHELNNPLDGILRYINLAMRLVDDAPESKLKSYLAESRSGLKRVVRIIGDLLDLSRDSHGELEESTVNEIIEQALKTLTQAIESQKIVVTVDLQHRTMPMVRGARLYQVCCNLIKNAVDAMPDGGRLAVTTGRTDSDVLIRITDTGPGLPVDIDALFQPFYTTKPPGKGTGLGLAICKDIIEDLQGAIVAFNAPEGGAVFDVRIPIGSFARCSGGKGSDTGPKQAMEQE